MTKPTVKQKLGSPISVEFPAEGRQMVRKAAFLSEQSLSAFVRAAALKAAAAVTDNDRKAA
jgi:uncharacterized protein (DUF1778 family)